MKSLRFRFFPKVSCDRSVSRPLCSCRCHGSVLDTTFDAALVPPLEFKLLSEK
jgi:hypothetical protein